MYDDTSWYSFVPELQRGRESQVRGSQPAGHKRKESLLQQPNVGACSQIPKTATKLLTLVCLGYISANRITGAIRVTL